MTKPNPQELAAEILTAFPLFNDVISKSEAYKLTRKAQKFKRQVEELHPYLLTDQELSIKLKQLIQAAKDSGIWDPRSGAGAGQRLRYATAYYQKFGYSSKEARQEAERRLADDGFAAAIRYEHQQKNKDFKEQLEDFLLRYAPGTVPTSLPVVDMSAVRVPTADLKKDFLNGNFLYHGTETEQLLKILESGYLSNAKTLYEQEQQRANREHQDQNIVRRNSGFEGISWSFNQIDALPGDRYHLAGFLTAPEVALSSSEQLTVPSRSAVYEVVQIPKAINPSTFYESKTQLELYCDTGIMGGANSVLGNLLELSLWRQLPKGRKFTGTPILYTAGRRLARQAKHAKRLQKLYTVEPGGVLRLNPSLLGQTKIDIPVACVWLQAMIDLGKLNNTSFQNKSLLDVINILNSGNTKWLIQLAKHYWHPYENEVNAIITKSNAVKVAVKNMYLVAAHKDRELWLKILAASPHQPRGLLLYDDKTVRLENFATDHRGDHKELTQQIRRVIPPTNQTITYADILGVEFQESMRAGRHHQIIAEQFLSNRRSLYKTRGALKVK